MCSEKAQRGPEDGDRAWCSNGCTNLADVRLVHDPGGGAADCYFAQGVPLLIPSMPCEAPHLFIHAQQ